MRPRPLTPWIPGDAVAMSLGFSTFIQTLMFLSFGLDFESHWSEWARPGSSLSPHLALLVGHGS